MEKKLHHIKERFDKYSRSQKLLGGVLGFLIMGAFLLVVLGDGRYGTQLIQVPGTLSVSSERQVCSLLGADAINAQITGQDGGDSIKHDNWGKSFWTFGDTTMVGSGPFPAISNNAAYSTDFDGADCVNLTHKKAAGKAVALVDKIAGEIAVWPDGMFIKDPVQNEVYFYYFSVESCSSCPLYPFTIRGMGLAKFDTTNMSSTRIGGLIWDNSSPSEDVWAAHPVIVGSDLYIFLDIRSNQSFVNVRLAKVPLSQVEIAAAYRYWNGVDFGAGTLSGAVGLWNQAVELNGVSVAYNQYLGKWLAVYTTGDANGTYRKVAARTAEQLTGPWSDELFLVDCASVFPGASGRLCYTGRQHPELEKNGGQTIYLSYANQQNYQVYLHEVNLNTGSPATYVYWVHIKGVFEASCCTPPNPTDITTDSAHTFNLVATPDPRGYEGVVCSPDCSVPAIWSGLVSFCPDQTLTLTPTGQTPCPQDTILPNVSIISPLSGAVAFKTVEVVAGAMDNMGVAKVEFYLDAGLKGTDYAAPYSWSWDTTTASNGTHTLYAKAYDTSNNTNTSANVVVIVDNAPPSVFITNPLNDSTVRRGSTVSITATATDATSGISKVEFLINGTLKCTDAITPYSCSWIVPKSKPGTKYTLHARAYDMAGNTALHTIVVYAR